MMDGPGADEFCVRASGGDLVVGVTGRNARVHVFLSDSCFNHTAVFDYHKLLPSLCRLSVGWAQSGAARQSDRTDVLLRRLSPRAAQLWLVVRWRRAPAQAMVLWLC